MQPCSRRIVTHISTEHKMLKRAHARRKLIPKCTCKFCADTSWQKSPHKNANRIFAHESIISINPSLRSVTRSQSMRNSIRLVHNLLASKIHLIRRELAGKMSRSNKFNQSIVQVEVSWICAYYLINLSRTTLRIWGLQHTLNVSHKNDGDRSERVNPIL